MPEILLATPQNLVRRVAIVDSADFDFLYHNYAWVYHPVPGASGYAASHEEGTTLYMHRLLLGLGPGDRRYADHINSNGLDNRRSNLRAVTPAQNGANKRKYDQGVKLSRFIGVQPMPPHVGKDGCKYPRKKLWRAYGTKRDGYRHVVTIGYFETEEEAARARDSWVREHGFSTSRLNFPDAKSTP